MDFCSYFIIDKALFGAYPSQERVEMLENQGVRYFIDLTMELEVGTLPYKTKYRYIKYPILDKRFPSDMVSFAKLVSDTCRIIRKLGDGEKIYIHCKGGHGRSGILVACVLCYYYGSDPNQALIDTNIFHSDRLVMRDKWRKIGSPQNRSQKEFVYRFFEPFRYTKNDFFGNNSPHSVKIGNNTFPTAYLAFLSFKDPENDEYQSELCQGNYRQELTNFSEDWRDNKLEYMFLVLEQKFIQHENLKSLLLETGLRPLVNLSHNSFWGSGSEYIGSRYTGKNKHGKMLERLRYQFLRG